LTLGDGTAVLLGPESRLTVGADYGQHAREVRLEGEAYFTVRHDAARPFFVTTKYAVAHDLGTRFTVRARGDESGIRVVVAEGSVGLASIRDSVVLGAADLGLVLPNGDVSRRGGANVGRWLAWTEGHLAFAETPLDQVAAELGRWFDVEI